MGIGTNNPSRNLSVYDASNAGVEIKTGTSGQSSVFFTDTADGNIGMIGYYHTDDSMFFRINDAERLRITSDGALNIGSGNETTNAANLVEMYVGATDESYATIRGKYNRSNEYNRSEVRFGVEDNSNGKGFLAFATGNNSATEKVRITSAGKVGINETSPDRHLHVKSGINTTDGAFRIESSTDNIMDMGTDGTGHFLNCVNADPFRIKFAGTEKLRITSGLSLIHI